MGPPGKAAKNIKIQGKQKIKLKSQTAHLDVAS